MITPYNETYFMQQAYNEALKAYDLGEIPIGAVIVINDQIIARAHNLTEQLNDVTAHAEIQAITAAAQNLGGKYLKNCTLYVTLEPCTMCAGALFWSQIDKIVFAATDEHRGACKIQPSVFHPKTEITQGPLSEESSALIKQFFASRRK